MVSSLDRRLVFSTRLLALFEVGLDPLSADDHGAGGDRVG
jgi:hypothetical protein